MPDPSVTVAVDAMGGDHAPEVVLEGVRMALAEDPSLQVLLVGPPDVVDGADDQRCTAVHASEVIGMGEHPASAVRAKKDSSIVVGCRLVRDGLAGGFFSAGSTGACMAAATLIMGRARGVTRPAIAAVIPTPERPTVLLDVGANADVKPEMLLQFGVMGAAYARTVLAVREPSIALLNIGEEPAKGSQVAQEAHALMSASLPGFIGNVEGRDLPAGTADVVVSDGFTGNVALKTMEGLARVLFSQVKEALSSGLVTRAAAAVIAPAIRALKVRLDPESHGGAPLLGVDGACIIGHGSSSARAVANGIAMTARAIRADIASAIARGIEQTGADA